jgi:hypothetical protein
LSELYVHHRIDTAPRQWQAVAERLTLAARSGSMRPAASSTACGAARSAARATRIQAITVWPSPMRAAEAERSYCSARADVWTRRSEMLLPDDPAQGRNAAAPSGQLCFRWFATPQQHWPEFLDLCAAAWPGFRERLRFTGDRTMAGDRRPHRHGQRRGDGRRACIPGVRSPAAHTATQSLAMWERSKLPEGKAESKVRDMLSRRYDLCDWTVVCTATLLTAADKQDKARWT